MEGFWDKMFGKKKEEEPKYVPRSEKLRKEKEYDKYIADCDDELRELEKSKKKCEDLIRYGGKGKDFISQEMLNRLAKYGYRVSNNIKEVKQEKFLAETGKVFRNRGINRKRRKKLQEKLGIDVQMNGIYEESSEFNPLADSIREVEEHLDRTAARTSSDYKCELNDEEQNYLNSILSDVKSEQKEREAGKDEVKKKIEELSKA